jgi:dihydroceramidase
MVQIVIFISGYVIWNIDNITCSWLTQAKRTIGMPLSFLLELHGWWHIFTGIGAYICMFYPFLSILPIIVLEVDLTYLVIALVEYLTSEEAGEPLAGRFAWPIDLFLRRPRSTPNIIRTGYGTLSKPNGKQLAKIQKLM